MTERYSEEEIVAAVTRLTRRQLYHFVESDLVRPERSGGGYVFRRIDIARLELLCDLSQDLDLDNTALSIVISLLDQLHAARQELAAMAHALDAVPADLRGQVLAGMKRR